MVAHAPAVTWLGTNRLVAYRGTLGGSTAVRIAFVDDAEVHDQPIEDAEAAGSVRVAAIPMTQRSSC